MTKFVDQNLYSKIISFASDDGTNLAKLKSLGFAEDSQLYSLLKEYCIVSRYIGNYSADIVSSDLPLKIQQLYGNDRKTKNFFDNFK